MKKAAIFLVVCLGLLTAAGTGVVTGFYMLNRPVEMVHEDDNIFTVESGDTLSGVADRLQAEGYIRSGRLFRILGRIYRTGGKMKTGLYRIEPGFSTRNIHDLLVSGSQVLFPVTIPEGWTSTRIAGLLEEKGITGADAFLEACRRADLIEKTGSSTGSVEGFLYPDTYYFALDYPAEDVAAHMVDTFFAALEEIFPDWRDMSAGDVYSKVTLASIVEREYRNPSEAALIASVFYNRIEQEMALGSCATVVYALTEEMGRDHPERLTYADLEIESDYNTYIHQGLPPGPIANPGYVALNAVFNPEKSDYLYFVLKDPETGTHHFSRNLIEHNQAYKLYIKRK